MVRVTLNCVAVCQKRAESAFWREWLRWRRKHKLVIQRFFFCASLNLQTCPTFLFLLRWTLMLVSRFGGGWERGCFIKYPYTLSLYCSIARHNLSMCVRETVRQPGVGGMCLRKLVGVSRLLGLLLHPVVVHAASPLCSVFKNTLISLSF